jgi:hypothetical protein
VKALERLELYLLSYYPQYKITDMRPSRVKGYFKTTKPCNCTYPPYDGHTIGFSSGRELPHCHTIYVGGILGFGHGKYAFWRAVCAELAAVETEEEAEG